MTAIPTLKTPPESTPFYTHADYLRDTANGGRYDSFAFCYFNALDALETGDLHAYVQRADDKKETCEEVNLLFYRMRFRLDQRMMEFLLEHDGVIDQWPDPSSSRGVSFDADPTHLTSTKFHFHYFGSDYYVKANLLLRQEPTMAYRNEYGYIPTKAYKDMKAEEQQLRDRVPSVVKHKTNRFIGFLCYLPAVILVGAALAGLVFHFFGISHEELLNALSGLLTEEATPLHNLLITLLAVPLLALGIGNILRTYMATSALWLVAVPILTAGIGIAVSKFLHSRFAASKASIQRKHALAQLQQFLDRPDYKRTMELHEQRRKDFTDLSEQWHKCWFTAYNATGIDDPDFGYRL